MKKWKQTAGFTLVELIVVIAILGILAGVGTVGYSGYIKKANIAADEQLIAGVKNAIQLAAISELGTEQSGYVILSKEQDVDCGGNAFLESAMENSFGSNWDKNHLKSDSWNGAAMLDTLDEYAVFVGPSSYIQHSDTATLLGDVQTCATALSGFLAGLMEDPNSPDARDTAGDLLGGMLGQERLANALRGSGLVGELQGDNNYDYSNVTSDALANATVFCLADYLENVDTKNEVVNTWWSYIVSEPTYNPIGNDNYLYDLACWYAAMEGFISYLGDEECTQYFSAIDMTSNNPSTIVSNMAAAHRQIFERIDGAEGVEIGLSARADEYLASQAEQDGKAFVAILGAVNDLSGNYSDASSMKDASLFTGSDMLSDLNSYVSVAEMYSAGIPTVSGPAVIITTKIDNAGNIALGICK